ncbi:MAG: amidohydrolase family protein [Candidatus Methanomethyliaceae archaeon]
MSIDFHTHPLLVKEMWERYPELERVARDVFFIRNRAQPLETFLLELDISGLNKAVLLPIDATTTRGAAIFSNEQIAELCQLSSRFIGFASVDPHAPNAPEILEYAIKELGLRGLKLSPPTQEVFPNDASTMYPIYRKAANLGIPVIFHTGMSWEPRARLKYGHPLLIEDVAVEFPDLKIILAHFGWPWVLDAVALALKYPNIYLDTACLYFGNPKDFLAFVMKQQIPLSLVEKSLCHKVVFGSDYPRVEIKNMARAVRESGLSSNCLELIFSVNPKRLLSEV